MDNIPGQIGKKEENYIKTAGILLSNSNELLEWLKGYDKDNINPVYI